MVKKRKYDRGEMREKLRNMFINIGIEVPDNVQPRRIIVHGEHGKIIEDRIIGEKHLEKKNI